MNGMNILPEFEGFAQANLETMEMLHKAMTAGSGVDAASFSGGRAITFESLDSTLVNILHSQEDAVLFQKLKKTPIKSVVHQWADRTNVGADDGAWVAEGGESEEGDSSLGRKYVTAKYLQTLRKVTLQASMSNTMEDAISLEKNSGTLWLIRNVEKALFYGDSSYVSEQPDGLIKLIPSSNVLDMRGGDATSATFEDKMNEAARVIRQNYGKAGLVLSSAVVMENVQALLRDRIRFEAKEGGLGGSFFTKYPTPFGSPDLKEDIFITEGSTPAASSLTSKRPGAVTINTATAASHASSLFVTADAGNYWYKVVAVNKYGDAVATATSSAVTVAAGDRVTLNVTEGSPAATAFKVYRSKKGAADASDCRYAFTVARTAATQDIFDTNSDLPGCSDTFILTTDPVYDAIEWAQFLPLMKFDLYPTNAAVFPFLMLLFGALALKKPVQHIRIKNVAPATLGWF